MWPLPFSPNLHNTEEHLKKEEHRNEVGQGSVWKAHLIRLIMCLLVQTAWALSWLGFIVLTVN